MCAAIGNKVVALHREKVGEVTLDAQLQPGEYRELSETEVASFN
jgi:16S rRNA pseudouridine516 synthase